MPETILNPFSIFEDWFAAAKGTEPNNPEAASLATCDQNGIPHVRIVLIKTADHNGFTFYTNLESAKARDLATNPHAALCFHWKSQSRQIRIEGSVGPVSREEADRYFETRARMSQIGAWASRQSKPLTNEYELETSIAKFTARFHIGKVPRPDFWSGFRLIPKKFEFWEERAFRLHRRRLFTKVSDQWLMQELFP